MLNGSGSTSTPVAAVDLGSNSFHMVIGRVLGDQLSILDRLRDPVRMAAGLDGDGKLDDKTLERILASLGRFRQRLAGIEEPRIRAIGTNAFRRARAPRDLLQQASAALGSPIEVLAGAEEARLIYLGVAHDQPHIEGRRLVVDIGGGSTECILGEGFQPIFKDSLYMGCVSFSLRYFKKGVLTRKAFRRAETAAKVELEGIQRRFVQRGWQQCVGSSGTINAIGAIVRQAGWTQGPITLSGLKKLRKHLIAAETIDGVALPGLQAERAPVLPGGLAILKALFESLNIAEMFTSKAALREGLLYDLLGRIRHEDVRDRTIRALSERYHVDTEHARNVELTALGYLEQVADDWELAPAWGNQLLGWAARMHELGLAISYSGHHKHGAYLLENSDMPGFTRQEQMRLAALVRGHRRKLTRQYFAELIPPWPERCLRLCVLLRLALLLHRTRDVELLPRIGLHAHPHGLRMTLPASWLDEHPLTQADLAAEAEALSVVDLRLEVEPYAAPAV